MNRSGRYFHSTSKTRRWPSGLGSIRFFLVVTIIVAWMTFCSQRTFMTSYADTRNSDTASSTWNAVWTRKGDYALANLAGNQKGQLLTITDLLTASGFEGSNNKQTAGEGALHRAIADLLISRVASSRLPTNRNTLSVLEVGCGSGSLAAFLYNRSELFATSRYVGVDYSETLLETAQLYFSQQQASSNDLNRNDSSNSLPRSRSVPTFLAGSAFGLSELVVPNSFDVVFCNSIMQYFGNGLADAEKMLAGMMRSVRPGGLIVLADILDKSLEAEALSRRRQAGYDARKAKTDAGKGKQLKHTYYHAGDLTNLARALGAETVDLLLTNRDLGVSMEAYFNAPFTYALVITMKTS